MKLQELGAQRPSRQIVDLIENHFGQRIDLDRLSAARAQHMLRRVTGMITEYRRTPDFHRSERDPAYLRMIMLEKALQAHMQEQEQAMVIDVNDPKTKQTIRKAEAGQNLTPDEQKTITAMALMKKESRGRTRRMVREQNELQQAQVVLASQDMVDRIQSMLEDVSEMQFKDLPALTDSIKQDMGTEQASQFSAQASQALSTLLTAIQAGKTQMESAQSVLTGDAITVPGTEPAAAPGEMPASEIMPAEPMPQEEPGIAPEPAALGRERR